MPAPFWPTSASNFSGPDLEIGMAHGPALAALLAKADILEWEAGADGLGHRQWFALRHDARPDCAAGRSVLLDRSATWTA